MSKIQSKPEKKQKDTYKIINWSAYNQSLIKRGGVTIWVEEEAIEAWYYEGPSQRGAVSRKMD